MQVTVRGDSPFVEIAEWRGAVRWYGEHLLGKRMADKVLVRIELTPYMRGMCGSVACVDWAKPRNFLIQIETGAGKRCKQLRTLAHEMVHVRQIVRREMRMGWPIPVWRMTHHPSAAYEDCPWEEEAYGREAELYRAYTASRRC